IEPNDSVSINSIIESRDAIFDENRFSSVPRPSLRISNGTEDIGDLVVPKEVNEEVVQQLELELRKSKRNRTSKDFGSEFQLYLIKGTRDEVSHQHSYCFNVEDDPKTFDEAIKSQDVAFWKEAINDEMTQSWATTLGCWLIYLQVVNLLVANGSLKEKVARISTIRLLIAMASIHNLIIHQMDVKTAFLNGDLDEEVLYEGHGGGYVILGIRIKHKSNGIAISQSHYIEKAVSQLEYSRVIGCLMYVMTCTRPDIAFDVGKLSRYTSNLVLEGYTDASWISNTEDNSSTSGWVFLLEFVALAAASKEVVWLKNLLLEILLWSKPILPISIRCESAATLAKAYSQMYNGKSRHLGVRHSMIRELITNGVISIEFVRSQQNLADH
ncbi:zinc finger, CCHC-type containing protein, partial [Tanacetum coccineum]